VKIAPPVEPPPEVMGRTITLADRAAVIRAAIRRADAIVLQDLLRDVRDRVVVAVTFLAMLELVKRREIVVEQSEPWGPIVARKISEAELAAAGAAASDEDEAIDESLESFG
jgi:chromatin segregation and condensation protein Rec8/ScpA/Scc1 (kleisin family)